MLRRLTRGVATVSELGEPFGFSKQAVSKHLQVLVDAGLIRKTQDGRVRRCEFVPDALIPVQQEIAELRAFWEDQMDALENYIQNMQEGKQDD